MKTPETKLDELKTELKEDNVGGVQASTHEIESNLTAKEPEQDTQALTNDAPQAKITDSTEIVEQVNVDAAAANAPAEVEPPMEQNLEVCEIQPVGVAEEPIAENAETTIEDLKDLSNDINIENIEPEDPVSITEDPVLESNKSEDHTADVAIPTDFDRVEGSIIHQTPDNENKVELEMVPTEPEAVLEKSNENVESMDVQVEDQIEEVTKSIEPEVSSDNPQEASVEPAEIKNDKQQDEESPVIVPTPDTIPTDMDIEPEKTDNDDIQQETVPANEETKATEPNTIIEEPQGQDDNKLTESE